MWTDKALQPHKNVTVFISITKLQSALSMVTSINISMSIHVHHLNRHFVTLMSKMTEV